MNQFSLGWRRWTPTPPVPLGHALPYEFESCARKRGARLGAHDPTAAGHMDTAQESSPLASTERLSFQEKLAYGLGDTASNFYFQFFNLFLVFYYTDIFGLAPLAVGTMMLSLRVFDAVIDPVVGLLADRTKSRWGKFRPYLLWGAIPYGVAGYVMFLNPSLTQHGRLVYAYVTYGLMWVAYAALNIPYSAITRFYDPSVQYLLQFSPPPPASRPPPLRRDETKEAAPRAAKDDGPKIVSLDQFRKK